MSAASAEDVPFETLNENIPQPAFSHLHPSQKKKRSITRLRLFRVFRSVFHSFPILTPQCSRFSSIKSPVMCLPDSRRSPISTGTRVTGTLFGCRKGRVNLSVQEYPKCLPTVVIELGMPTNVLLREMGSGTVRIALECEKSPEKNSNLLDEPLWSMFCNGKKSGYGVRREATEEDLGVMEALHAVSMGAGVLPSRSDEGSVGGEGEMAYIRANFDHVVGSKDSETLYMVSPDGNNGPDLTIFFVRI